MAQRTEREWVDLDTRYDVMKRQTGWDTAHMADALGIKRQTLRDRLKTRIKSGTLPDDVNPWAGEVEGTPTEHQGTLEEYQKVIAEVHQSVPDAPHVGTEEEHPGVPEHLSTPVVHPELSPDDSTTAHSGVPARQDQGIGTPMVHPGTPTAEDWELWTIIKARWLEVEKMLADRQAVLSTPRSTPGHTQKKTYVFDVRHIAMIQAYADEHRLELKDVIYAMCEEFFQRR
jgi:hypothetical protein